MLWKQLFHYQSKSIIQLVHIMYFVMFSNYCLNASKLVQAVTELKGAELEDGELEEFLRDLKYLPELVDGPYVTPGDLPARMREANIHERYTTYNLLLIFCICYVLWVLRYIRIQVISLNCVADLVNKILICILLSSFSGKLCRVKCVSFNLLLLDLMSHYSCVFRGTVIRESVVTARNDVRDRKILWPPMVIFVNTRYSQDDNGKVDNLFICC